MAVPQGSVKDVWEDRAILMEVVGGLETQPAFVVKLNGLERRMFYMDSRRWREFAGAIVVNFGDVETGYLLGTGGSIASSQSQQMSV